MTGRKQGTTYYRAMSRARAQGLADLIRNRRIKGRWQPFKSIQVGAFKIEYREELPMDGRYEVTENGAYRRRLYSLEDAILEIAELCPELDWDKIPLSLEPFDECYFCKKLLWTEEESRAHFTAGRCAERGRLADVGKL